MDHPKSGKDLQPRSDPGGILADRARPGLQGSAGVAGDLMKKVYDALVHVTPGHLREPVPEFLRRNRWQSATRQHGHIVRRRRQTEPVGGVQSYAPYQHITQPPVIPRWAARFGS